MELRLIAYKYFFVLFSSLKLFEKYLKRTNTNFGVSYDVFHMQVSILQLYV